MHTILALAQAEFLGIRSWLREQTFSKVLVMGGFLCIFSLVALFIYFFSGLFFHSLSSYEKYGLLTAQYLIHAAIIIIAWFALISCVVSTLTFLLRTSPSTEYVLSLPVKQSEISGWFFIKLYLVNSILLIFAVLPVSFSFAVYFNGGIDLFFTVRSIYVLVMVVLLTASLGVLIAYGIVWYVRKNQVMSLIVGILTFLAGSYALAVTIFPKKLSLLYFADPSSFNQIYDSLPLNNSLLPTKGLAEILTTGVYDHALVITLLIFLLIYLADFVQSKYFLLIHQKLQVFQQLQRNGNVKKIQSTFIINSSEPLLTKDILSILRVPSEVGYTIFLVLLAIFFFTIIGQTSRFRPDSMTYQKELILFVFMWMMFFSTTFFMRIVYPLVAREGKSSWYIFTLPISKNLFFETKIIVSLLSAIPFVLLSVLVWMVIPYAVTYRTELILVSISSILVLAYVHGCMSFVYPQFSIGDDAERVSTSMSGIGTLITAFGISGGTGYLLYQYLQEKISLQVLVIILICLFITLVLALGALARTAKDRYQF
jgi:hypothetical protein